MLAILLNKNWGRVKNKAIKMDLVIAGCTIIIPIILLKCNVEFNLYIVPLLIFFYIAFKFLHNIMHEVYLQKEEDKIKGEIEEERKQEKLDKRKISRYVIILVISGVLLYIVGELLGNTLENLCTLFKIPQVIVGILLGFITSIPELITFFESQRHHNDAQNYMLGVIEATNNLFTSNMINLFVIQTIGIIIINIVK